MELRPHQLEQRLQRQGIAPFYYVAGNEFVLVEESIQTLVDSARETGFDEVVRTEVAGKDDWESVFTEASSSALFAEKRLFLVNLTRRQWDRNSTATIEQYLKDPDPNSVLVVRGSTFDYQQRRLAWFKLLTSKAEVVIAEPLPPPQFRGWIENRSNSLKLRITEEALDTLADLTQGNLLAARQELTKLQLVFLKSDEAISVEHLTQLDSSTGNMFELLDSACYGNFKMIGQQLMAVIRNGTDPLAIIGLLSLQLRRMHSLALGENIPMSRMRMRPLESAVRRLGHREIEQLIFECTHIDSQRKGILTGDPWESVHALLLRIAGSKNLMDCETNLQWHEIEYEN